MKLLKIPYDTPQKLFSIYQPNADYILFSEPFPTPYELIQNSRTNENFSHVITFLAHGLPIREAVWWAVCCASKRTDWNESELNAIQSARAWVHAPDEANRRYAEDMAKKAGLESGAGWAAQSAFWSGGSMIDPDSPEVLPPAYLYAQAVSGCITLTAVLPYGENAEQRYNEFIDIGLNIAMGGNGKVEK
ncbi:Twin-arginine translocation pathway signal [Parashewanella curva]|uniref:Twin-arginine translocation pathway signal n=1 Tax=Parashewanella curva TaxID=2338552 RepID=A0A3L8Q0X7_9GAMM|nr:Twin-arginine translocation pathway signal [Parashewanella curva]RLV61234.1 Twin-arginine translocation pathway signal [Parashewanella curva]